MDKSFGEGEKMSAARSILLLCAFSAALISCQGPDQDQSPDQDQGTTLTFYSESALDGVVVWEGGSTFSGSSAGASVSIGDNAADAVMRCVVSFNLSALPAGAQIDSATLRMYQDANHTGDSYDETNGLGVVYVTNISYAALTTDDALFTDDTTGTDIGIGPLATSFSANTWHELDVTTSSKDEVNLYHNGRLQFRVYHHYESNHDGSEDSDGWAMGDSATNKPELVIVYH
jgi:hypothetical protein